MSENSGDKVAQVIQSYWRGAIDPIHQVFGPSINIKALQWHFSNRNARIKKRIAITITRLKRGLSIMYESIVLKVAFGLIGLLFFTRLLGKKSMSDITPFDLIYTLVLGGLLEESIYDEKIHLVHFFLALTVWGVMIYSIETLVQKNDRINKWIKGEPCVLVQDGQLNIKGLNSNHVEMEQLRTMMRQQNCFSLQEAKHVILETGGTISVMKNEKEDTILTILLIDEGKLSGKALDSIHKTEDWLRERLRKEGQTQIEEIAYAEWSSERGLYIKTYADSIKEPYEIDG